MLSACSQQIQTIQEALTTQAATSVAPGQKGKQNLYKFVKKKYSGFNFVDCDMLTLDCTMCH